jgi:hypothetical protein
LIEDATNVRYRVEKTSWLAEREEERTRVASN